MAVAVMQRELILDLREGITFPAWLRSQAGVRMVHQAEGKHRRKYNIFVEIN